MVLRTPLFSALLLAACSTSGEIKDVSRPYAGPLHEYEVTVRVDAEDVVGEDLVAEVQAELQDQLADAALFRGIASRDGDVELRVTLMHVRDASDAGFWCGALAGSNRLMAEVSLTRRGGQLLQRTTVEASSASHPFSARGEMVDAIRTLVREVVAFLSGAGTPRA